MATPPRADPPKQQPDPKQSQHQHDQPHDHAHEEHEAHKHEEEHKGEKPKHPILPEGQAYQLFYNGHKIARDGDPPTQWLSMGRLADGSSVVQSPMTPDLEKKLKEGKFYLADNVSDDPPAPQPRRDPL
jgi:hypothetical protein